MFNPLRPLWLQNRFFSPNRSKHFFPLFASFLLFLWSDFWSVSRINSQSTGPHFVVALCCDTPNWPDFALSFLPLMHNLRFGFIFLLTPLKNTLFLCIRLEHEGKARNDDEIEIGYYIMLSSTRRHQAEKKRRLDLEKNFSVRFWLMQKQFETKKNKKWFYFSWRKLSTQSNNKEPKQQDDWFLNLFSPSQLLFFFDEMDDWHVSRMLWLGSSAVEEMEILLSHKTDPKLQHKRARDVFMACENECRLCAKWSSGRSWICWIMVIATFIYSLAPAQPIIFCNNNLH